MKKVQSIVSMIILCMACIACSPAKQESKSTDCATPDRVMLSIPGNPATTRAVTWMTGTGVESAQAQISIASATPFIEETTKTVQATTTEWETGNPSALGHKVYFKDLEPATMYLYRVGNGEVWSEWFQFKTAAAEAQPFNFLYLGDLQNDIKDFGSRMMRQAYSHFPKSAFILYAGDLAGEHGETWWDEFFYAGGWIFGSMPSLPTPGNNEYYSNEAGEKKFSKQWDQIFVNPANGPAGVENRTFYVDYQGTRFISIDSSAMSYYPEIKTSTIVWLEDKLANNPNQWTVVFTHFPVYSCSQGRKDKDRVPVKGLLEKYGVDLVLQGHDHAYCRGQYLENVGKDCKNAPMYMVSVAGPKMYGLGVDKWSDRVASEIQLYQNVIVNEKEIVVEVYTVLGELYDKFSIVKDPKGGFNKIVEADILKDIEERHAIPAKMKKKYTEEDMKLYKERFK